MNAVEWADTLYDLSRSHDHDGRVKALEVLSETFSNMEKRLSEMENRIQELEDRTREHY